MPSEATLNAVKEWEEKKEATVEVTTIVHQGYHLDENIIIDGVVARLSGSFQDNRNVEIDKCSKDLDSLLEKYSAIFKIFGSITPYGPIYPALKEMYSDAITMQTLTHSISNTEEVGEKFGDLASRTSIRRKKSYYSDIQSNAIAFQEIAEQGIQTMKGSFIHKYKGKGSTGFEQIKPIRDALTAWQELPGTLEENKDVKDFCKFCGLSLADNVEISIMGICGSFTIHETLHSEG